MKTKAAQRIVTQSSKQQHELFKKLAALADELPTLKPGQDSDERVHEIVEEATQLRLEINQLQTEVNSLVFLEKLLPDDGIANPRGE